MEKLAKILSQFDELHASTLTSTSSPKKKAASSSGGGTGYAGSAGLADSLSTGAAAKQIASALSIQTQFDNSVSALFSKLSSRLKLHKRGKTRLTPEWALGVHIDQHWSGAHACCLMILRSQSLTDIVERAEIYTILVTFLSSLADASPSSLKSFIDFVNIDDESDDLLVWEESRETAKLSTALKSLKLVATNYLSLSMSSKITRQGEEVEEKICRTIVDSMDHISSLVSFDAVPSPAKKKQEGNLSTAEMEEEYTTLLKPLAFATFPNLITRLNLRKLGGSGSSAGGTGVRMKRIKREMSSLITDLPIYSGGSIFVRCDEDKIDAMQVLITGPEGSPYEHGAYIFDLLLPSNYPNSPPKMQLVTTGGGRVRFNPNLYADGKVCLSLLGTWSGPGWDPKTSTLLQVLVSIQSLIMVPDPFYNEPGFQGGDYAPQSDAYTARVRSAKFQLAVNDQLGSICTDPVWGEVLTKHFQMKSDRLFFAISSWTDFEGKRKRGYKGKGGRGMIQNGGVELEVQQVQEIATSIRQRLSLISGGGGGGGGVGVAVVGIGIVVVAVAVEREDAQAVAHEIRDGLLRGHPKDRGQQLPLRGGAAVAVAAAAGGAEHARELPQRELPSLRDGRLVHGARRRRR